MFVSKYAPAHKFNRVAAFWQSPVIPNRPHLTDEASNNQRYDILHIGTVESAHLVVPDLGRSSYYWAVIHADTCLWHEAYADDGEGEEEASTRYSTLVHSPKKVTISHAKLRPNY